MKAEFTAIIEPDPSGGYWAICPDYAIRDIVLIG